MRRLAATFWLLLASCPLGDLLPARGFRIAAPSPGRLDGLSRADAGKLAGTRKAEFDGPPGKLKADSQTRSRVTIKEKP